MPEVEDPRAEGRIRFLDRLASPPLALRSHPFDAGLDPLLNHRAFELKNTPIIPRRALPAGEVIGARIIARTLILIHKLTCSRYAPLLTFTHSASLLTQKSHNLRNSGGYGPQSE